MIEGITKLYKKSADPRHTPPGSPQTITHYEIACADAHTINVCNILLVHFPRW